MYVYPTRPVLLHSAFTLASSTPLLSTLSTRSPSFSSPLFYVVFASLALSFVRFTTRAFHYLVDYGLKRKKSSFLVLFPSPLHTFRTPSRQHSPLCLPVFRFLSIAFYPFLAIWSRANMLACPSHGCLIFFFLLSSLRFAAVSITNGASEFYIYIYRSVASDRNGSSFLSRVGSTFSIDSRFGPGSIWLSRIPGFEVEFESKSLFLLKIKVDRVWNKSWAGTYRECITREVILFVLISKIES